MKEELTVDKAIQKGHQMVNYPIFAIMVLGLGLTFFFAIYLQSGLAMIVGFLLTFIAAWIWWSFRITKWRIWAFENCRNVHELKRRAINEKLIWPDGNRFERTEIRSLEQKNRLNLIDKKFSRKDKPEVVLDDGTTKTETKIYYSRVSIIINWLSVVMAVVFGVILIIKGSLSGYFVILLSLLVFYYAYQKTIIKDAIIVLNPNGIKTLNTSFTPWENIEMIETQRRGMGKNSKWYLVIQFKNNDINGLSGDELEVNDLSESPESISKLIKLYQQRNRLRKDRP